MKSACNKLGYRLISKKWSNNNYSTACMILEYAGVPYRVVRYMQTTYRFCATNNPGDVGKTDQVTDSDRIREGK